MQRAIFPWGNGLLWPLGTREVIRMGDEDGVARVVTAIRDNAASRSPLYRYLWRHRKALARAMGSRRVNWAAMAAELAGLKLHDAAGQLASAGSVQKAWAKVQRDESAARGRAARRPAPMPAAAKVGPGEVVPGVRLVAATTASGSDNVPQPAKPAHASQALAPTRPPVAFTTAARSASTASAQLEQLTPDAADGMAPGISRAENALSRLRATIEEAQPQMPAVAGRRFRKG